MPNIQGAHTLSETALKLNVSPSWINKIQTRTGIGGETGTSGKKASFKDDDVKTLKNVKILRALELEIDDIKNIFEIEKKMIRIYEGYKTSHPSQKEVHSYIVHPYNFEYPLFVKADGEDIDKKSAEIYAELAKEIFKISKEVEKRAGMLAEDLQTVRSKMMENSRIKE